MTFLLPSIRAARSSSGRLGAIAGALALGVALVPAAAGAASSEVVYDNIPSPQPGNVPSWGYEATQTSEFGGQVQLAGTDRDGLKVTALMSSWGCENGSWNGGPTSCQTTPGATFSHPITMSVYQVASGGGVGALVTEQTETFTIPYRPSASPACGDGRWQDSTGTCFNGYATPITFAPTASSVTWPTNAIVTLSYNTTHYGDVPIGESASCYGQDGGCGYDSLNVGTGDSPATTGSQPAPTDAYLDSDSGGFYCDGGLGGTGTLREDSPCNVDFQPAFRIASVAPANADDCKKGGWMSYDNPTFKNQGDCVSWVNSNRKR